MLIKEIKFFSPSKIAESGQAFRINIIDDTRTELTALGHYLQIADMGNNRYAFSCSEKEFNDIWFDYFNLGRNYEEIISKVSDDDYLLSSIEYGYGIRILKQESFETLLSYIISQRRSIPSIKTSVEKLCCTFGRRISLENIEQELQNSDTPFISPLKDEYYAFPSPEALIEATTEDFAKLGTGYRAQYLACAVHDVLSGKIDLESLSSVSDEELFSVLTSMYGVGKKVADCTMLFGFGRTGRFPIDVWMQRILDKYYNGKFDTSPYPDTAGIMQQFMFFYERTRP